MKSGWAKRVSLDRQLTQEKENYDPKNRVDQARQPGKAVGPIEEKENTDSKPPDATVTARKERFANGSARMRMFTVVTRCGFPSRLRCADFRDTPF